MPIDARIPMMIQPPDLSNTLGSIAEMKRRDMILGEELRRRDAEFGLREKQFAEDQQSNQFTRGMQTRAEERAIEDRTRTLDKEKAAEATAKVEWALRSDHPGKAFGADPAAAQMLREKYGVDITTLPDDEATRVLEDLRGAIASAAGKGPPERKFAEIGNDLVEIPEVGDPRVIHSAPFAPRQDHFVQRQINLPNGMVQNGSYNTTTGKFTPEGEPFPRPANPRYVLNDYTGEYEIVRDDGGAAPAEAVPSPAPGLPAPSAGPSKPSLPQPKNEAEFNALPPGTEYLDPYGDRRRKPEAPPGPAQPQTTRDAVRGSRY